jgi:hypothetical protein
VTDTIDAAEVPESERLDRDEDPTDPDLGSAALEDGDDVDSLEQVYADPGPIVTEDLG